jgi:hypothetical protein
MADYLIRSYIAACKGAAICIPDRKELWSSGCAQFDELRLCLLHVFVHTALLQLYINKTSDNRPQTTASFMLVIGKHRKCFGLRRPSSGGILTNKQIYNVVNSIVLIGCMIWNTSPKVILSGAKYTCYIYTYGKDGKTMGTLFCPECFLRHIRVGTLTTVAVRK